MSVQSVKVRVKGGYIEIPFTDPGSVERVFRGVAEIRRVVSSKSNDGED